MSTGMSRARAPPSPLSSLPSAPAEHLVRICVCGDEATGKSSLITSLAKDAFPASPIPAVLPHVTVPPTPGIPDDLVTTVVDTSALPQERNALRKELRTSNVILLVYSDHYSYERVALFWMPYFRSLGVNVPVVLCANKSDLGPAGAAASVVDDEMLPVMAEFKEIDSCIRTSARDGHNVNELFFLCQKAVTHPIAPLFDSKESELKPAAVAALRRIFYLCDKDQDGFLSDDELHAFQVKCFGKPLANDDLTNIKQSIARYAPASVSDSGVDMFGFVLLNRMYAEKGRHETVWIILRAFHYTDSLSLRDAFLHPRFDVPQHASAELSPAGYRFFVDLFLLFDKDSDGGLSPDELDALFAPTPGLPPSWIDSSFPSSTVRNEAGHITLQGWLAQWSMTTFVEPKTTLEYLALLGFDEDGTTTAALRLTRARKRRRRPGRVERNVVLCYVLGGSHSGKSSLLDAFLNRPFSHVYHPTIKPRTAVNGVEVPGGKQCYLIVRDLLIRPGCDSRCDSSKSSASSSTPSLRTLPSWTPVTCYATHMTRQTRRVSPTSRSCGYAICVCIIPGPLTRGRRSIHNWRRCRQFTWRSRPTWTGRRSAAASSQTRGRLRKTCPHPCMSRPRGRPSRNSLYNLRKPPPTRPLRCHASTTPSSGASTAKTFFSLSRPWLALASPPRLCGVA